MKPKVLLGITSSIAAYKVIELITRLQKQDIYVDVIMTHHATKMLAREELEKIGCRVYTDLFPQGFDYTKVLEKKEVEHIKLADATSLMAIIPATANTIAKLAHGFADDLLTTTALAIKQPLLIAPAMNTNMWNNPITQENIKKLHIMGHIVIEPTVGMLACGYEGKGKLENIDILVDEILRQLSKSTRLKGKKIIVTSGGTTEPIDDVRAITNKSSGKMGVSLAEELFLQGAEVILLRAKNATVPRYLFEEHIFQTSDELFTLIQTYTPEAYAIFHAAAVGDFAIKKGNGKLSSEQEHTLKLTPQRKIVEEIKQINPNIQLFAFKAVYGSQDILQDAKEKLSSASADAVIANDISKTDRGFGSDDNEVTIVTPDQTKMLNKKPKKELAKEIIDYLL